MIFNNYHIFIARIHFSNNAKTCKPFVEKIFTNSDSLIFKKKNLFPQYKPISELRTFSNINASVTNLICN